MKILILSLLFAAPAFADAAPECKNACCPLTSTVSPARVQTTGPATVTTTTTVVSGKAECPTPAKPPVKKAVKKKVKKKAATIVLPPKTVVAYKDAPKKVEEKESDWILGLHGAVGLGFRDPNTSGLLGLRLRYKPLHLGLEAYTAFDYGNAVQLMVYTVQGKRFSHHIDVGVLFTGKHLLSTQDIPRTWDATLGTGIEYKLFKYLSLTADWRLAFPSPAFVAGNNYPIRNPDGTQVFGQPGRYISTGNAIGNSLTQSQFLLGVLLHTK